MYTIPGRATPVFALISQIPTSGFPRVPGIRLGSNGAPSSGSGAADATIARVCESVRSDSGGYFTDSSFICSATARSSGSTSVIGSMSGHSREEADVAPKAPRFAAAPATTAPPVFKRNRLSYIIHPRSHRSPNQFCSDEVAIRAGRLPFRARPNSRRSSRSGPDLRRSTILARFGTLTGAGPCCLRAAVQSPLRPG